jgi:hypothetical protein
MKWLYCTCFTFLTLLAHAQVSSPTRDSIDNITLPYSGGCSGINAVLVTPSPVYACTGGTAQFIAAMLWPFTSKHWEQSSDNGATWTIVPGSSAVYPGFGTAGLDTLTLTNITNNMNGYKYRCYFGINCSGGIPYTIPGTLNVSTSGSNTINIIGQPANVPNVCMGTPIQFTVQANGPGIWYQWQQSTNGGTNFINIPTATASTCSLAADTALNNYRYRCWIQGACVAPVYSNIVVQTAYPKPNLGADSVVNLACIGCTTNITGLYNTAGYTANWNTPNTVSVRPGIYRLTVNNANGCSDTAVVHVNTVMGDTVRVCKGGAVGRISSNIVGATYIWEVDLGLGGGFYVLMRSDSDGLMPIETPYITTADIIPGNTGTRYRCKVNGNLYSRTTHIYYTAVWNGSANNNWDNPANWGCGVLPSTDTDVFITSGNVVLNVNTTVRSLTLSPGVNFSIAPGATLQVLH